MAQRPQYLIHNTKPNNKSNDKTVLIELENSEESTLLIINIPVHDGKTIRKVE